MRNHQLYPRKPRNLCAKRVYLYPVDLKFRAKHNLETKTLGAISILPKMARRGDTWSSSAWARGAVVLSHVPHAEQEATAPQSASQANLGRDDDYYYYIIMPIARLLRLVVLFEARAHVCRRVCAK